MHYCIVVCCLETRRILEPIEAYLQKSQKSKEPIETTTPAWRQGLWMMRDSGWRCYSGHFWMQPLLYQQNGVNRTWFTRRIYLLYFQNNLAGVPNEIWFHPWWHPLVWFFFPLETPVNELCFSVFLQHKMHCQCSILYFLYCSNPLHPFPLVCPSCCPALRSHAVSPEGVDMKCDAWWVQP